MLMHAQKIYKMGYRRSRLKLVPVLVQNSKCCVRVVTLPMAGNPILHRYCLNIKMENFAVTALKVMMLLLIQIMIYV